MKIVVKNTTNNEVQYFLNLFNIRVSCCPGERSPQFVNKKKGSKIKLIEQKSKNKFYF